MALLTQATLAWVTTIMRTRGMHSAQNPETLFWKGRDPGFNSLFAGSLENQGGARGRGQVGAGGEREVPATSCPELLLCLSNGGRGALALPAASHPQDGSSEGPQTKGSLSPRLAICHLRTSKDTEGGKGEGNQDKVMIKNQKIRVLS